MRLDLTPHATAVHWTTWIIGTPWAADFTCWDMVRVVQLTQFGRAMPAYDVADARAPEQLRSVVQACGWQRIDGAVLRECREGDVLLMRGPDGLHIGVVVRVRDAWQLLHNLGGLVDGVAQGSVRIDPVADLGQLGYGRFELWRAAA